MLCWYRHQHWSQDQFEVLCASNLKNFNSKNSTLLKLKGLYSLWTALKIRLMSSKIISISWYHFLTLCWSRHQHCLQNQIEVLCDFIHEFFNWKNSMLLKLNGLYSLWIALKIRLRSSKIISISRYHFLMLCWSRHQHCPQNKIEVLCDFVCELFNSKNSMLLKLKSLYSH